MDRFEALLQPFSKHKFLEEYWGKEPLYIARESERKLQDYPGLAELPRMLMGEISPEGWAWKGVGASASYIDQHGKEETKAK